MSWVRFDDGFMRHPKVLAAGRDARDLYIAAMFHCGTHLTDGFIMAPALPLIAAEAGVPYDEANTQALASRLVEVGLWQMVQGGYQVHDYLGCSFDYTDARQYWDRIRPQVAPKVYELHGRTCFYCGGTEDLTIDHKTPLSRGGSNELTNLVPACRSCNRNKGTKTAEEWIKA